MQVYIPTKGRGIELQHTYNKISDVDKRRYNVTLLVESQQEAEYFTSKGARVLATGVYGIGPARQWALDHSPEAHVLMLDDDLTSWAQRNSEGQYLKGDDSLIIGKGIQAVAELLTSYAHAGIGHRQFANNKPWIDNNGRIMRALGYDRDVLKKHGFRITLPLMEDFELNLKLLTAGYESANYYGVVQDQSASNTPGGCRDMRTLELQELSARGLQAMFPEFVKLKQAEGWDIGTRWDVSVQWKKALGAYWERYNDE